MPAANVLTFNSDMLQVPQLTESDGEDYVAEGAELPEGTMTWSSLSFPAKKIGRIQWASSEILEDSALDLRNIIGQNLLRDASLRFDADAFNGGLTDPVKGILAQGTVTSLEAGKATVTYDDVADACARVEAMNGSPSVVWASTDMGAALRKEKASGSGEYQGGSPTGSPASTAWGLPVMVSGFLPAKTVVDADASRLFVGIRRNATIKISEDARFTSDQVGFKLTMRVAGVGVAEASSVQVIKAVD
ncbi:phage major capsid protein [Streptomyces sp. SMS_SU21]|uniref:phage major capsid protein n=1 Tax=Streptomyces sp. SMS_SU21 TaxID=2069440 RepID=UPI001CD9CE8D|nr:phage major capsid protein [Streptomyces sp. SMS_SU21]MCA2200340.1 phage major capsid protein [Streptomyces sp. SMS_SU21]